MSLTEPNVVRNLSVTDITTSSIFLMWIEPDGKSSFYRVQWTRGDFNETVNVTQTHINITNLTPGVQYKITVTTVACDNITEGQSSSVTKYTSKFPQSCNVLGLGSGSESPADEFAAGGQTLFLNYNYLPFFLS